ncbi:hypothetical protein GBA52_009017 [Prunus armeniaca]|nr:hypothetical protein GBA52_009017 [Prunus armeniaca]
MVIASTCSIPSRLLQRQKSWSFFSVEKQLLSSHSGKPNLQLVTDALLSLKMMFKKYFFGQSSSTATGHVCIIFIATTGFNESKFCSFILDYFSYITYCIASSLRLQWRYNYLVNKSEILNIDFSTSSVAAVMNDIATSVFFEKGGEDVLKFFDSLQPLLMENLFSEGFSVGLEDFSMSRASIQDIQKNIQDSSDLLYHLRSTYNEFVEFQLQNRIRSVKVPVSHLILESSALGFSESGTLFKNLMAILRNVVICYDGTVRNVCSNSIIQFEYEVNTGSRHQHLFPAGEPVGVLAATAMSNPAYKAVLDSTPSSNSSWELMKVVSFGY